MIKKTLTFIWSQRFHFWKYFVVGCSAYLLDMGSLIFLKRVFGIEPTIGVAIAQPFVIGIVFLCNKYWTFESTEMPHWQLVRYLILLGFNYLVAIGCMYIFHTLLGFDYKLVRTGTVILATSWNFLLYKYWVYRALKPEVLPL